MPVRLGNDYRVFIEGTTAGAYSEILGQLGVNLGGSTSFFDTSTKDTGTYATQAPSQRNVSMTLNLRPKLPDANGFGRLEAVANADPVVPVGVQIRYAPYGTSDVVFQARMYVDIAREMPVNGVFSATANFALAEAPTVDSFA